MALLPYHWDLSLTFLSFQINLSWWRTFGDDTCLLSPADWPFCRFSMTSHFLQAKAWVAQEMDVSTAGCVSGFDDVCFYTPLLQRTSIWALYMYVPRGLLLYPNVGGDWEEVFLRVSVCASLSGFLNQSECLCVNSIYLTFDPTGDMLFWNSV